MLRLTHMLVVIGFVASLLATAGHARAQELVLSVPPPERPVWTVAELEALALQTNPTLVQTRAAIDAARGMAFQATRRPNPTVGYLAEQAGNAEGAGQHSVIFGQRILRPQQVAWRGATAEAEVVRTEQAAAAQEQRVVNDVRALFYETFYAQQQVELAQQLVGVAEEGAKVAEARYAGLEAGRGDVLQARIERSVAKLRLADSEIRLTRSWRALAAVIGLPDLEHRPLAGDPSAGLMAFEWNATLQHLLAVSPEVAEAAAAVERAHFAYHREIADARSDLQITTAVGFDDSTEDYFATAGFQWPWRIRDRRTGAIEAARAQWLAAQHELRRVELDLQHRLATAFQSYDLAHRRFQAYDGEILPHARESLELVRHGYEAGEYNYPSLLAAQRTYMQASLDRLDALRELRNISISIEGLLLHGALQSQPAASPQ